MTEVIFSLVDNQSSEGIEETSNIHSQNILNGKITSIYHILGKLGGSSYNSATAL
jgi:hypothetical protein